MGSFTFSLALAFAIVCISFGSTRAAPASANSCQTECKYKEYCDERTSSCTACFDCETVNRIPAQDEDCAKTGSDCIEDCLPEFELVGNECWNSSMAGNDTEARTPPPGVTPGEKHGTRNDGDQGTGTGKDTIKPPDGHPAASSWDNLTTILVVLGVLVTILVAVVCIGRRSCGPNEGGGWPPKRPRTGEETSAHFQRGVPDNNELDKAGSDGEVELYDRKIREPVRNQDDDQAALVGLLEDVLYNQHQAVVPAEAQEPRDPNGLGDNETSGLLDPDGALTLHANYINDLNQAAVPEEEQADDNILEVANNLNGAVVHEAEQQADYRLEILPDFRDQLDDELQFVGDNDENLPGNGNESGNDSGISDDDKGRDAQDNPIARLTNTQPHLFEPVNHRQIRIVNRPGAERDNMNLEDLPDWMVIRNP